MFIQMRLKMEVCTKAVAVYVNEDRDNSKRERQQNLYY